MGELVNIVAIIKGVPTEFTIALSVFVAFVTIWVKSRDIDINAATSISRLQMEQNKSMMEQNKALSTDLKELRDKLSDTYELVNKLRHQVAELENTILLYEHKCDSCPHKPK